MNKNDSERIASYYEELGFRPASSWQESDVIVINTCAIRKSAEDSARAKLHQIKQFFDKKVAAEQAKKPGASSKLDPQAKHPKIVFTGCMLHYGSEKIQKMLPMVDQILEVGEVGFDHQALRTEKNHAFVPISSGCNSFCSYCIVPYSRGREKSRSKEEILAEIESLIKQGYTEITLLGQNVNSWGLEKVGVSLRKMLMSSDSFSREDLPTNQSQYLKPDGTPPFVELLQKITAYPEIKLVRFLSANPWDFHDELIAEIGRNPKIDRYVHLPIQSGSNSVLERMNRGYSRENYLEIAQKLRQADPKIVLGTDIIIGFPGETDAEFNETLDLAKQIDWQVAFIALYSPRPGTASAKLYSDDVPHLVKKQRYKILDQLINKAHLQERPKVV